MTGRASLRRLARGAVALEARRRVAVAGVPRLGPRRAVRAATRRAALAVARPADPDAPRALADLDLAEARRRELRDQGRQQVVGEAVDRGVVGRPLVRRPIAAGLLTGAVILHLRQTSSRAGGS